MPFALATFNVKNLFKPSEDRDAPLLPRKVDAIAGVLRDCDADVIGLQEVGSVELLQEVLAKLTGYGYRNPIVGTADARGIRCALLSRLPVVRAVVHTSDALSFPVYYVGDSPPFGTRIPLRRGVVSACIDAPRIGPIEVMVVHFKSPLPLALRNPSGSEVPATTPHARAEGMLRSLVWRAAEALHVRALVDQILADDPHARIAVVGDMNDAAESPVLRALRSEGDGRLLDCTSAVLPEGRYSAIHRGVPIQIDHMLATGALHGRLTDARFLNAQLRDHEVLDPRQGEPYTVDSDHAAVVARFE